MALEIRYADGRRGEVNDPGDALEVYRHSTSHLMAAAVSSLFPGTHLGIGPAVSDGFFYDFERPEKFTEEDLGRIEANMRDLVAQDLEHQPTIGRHQDA